MAAAGIFSEDDRVELIEGEIVEMPPIGSRHAACVDRLNRLFSSQVVDSAIVRVQNPVRLDQHSEPQPDLVLAIPRADFYATSHPRPDQVLLLVEVADTTVGFDRSVKAPLYARAGVREFWLVDLDGELVQVHREPAAESYRAIQAYRRGDRLSCGALPQIEVAVDAILGE